MENHLKKLGSLESQSIAIVRKETFSKVSSRLFRIFSTKQTIILTFSVMKEKLLTNPIKGKTPK